MKNNKTVGYKIQTIRENKNMSRKEVAEQAGLSEEQAVSYTHLDVYKRQDLQCTGKCR